MTATRALPRHAPPVRGRVFNPFFPALPVLGSAALILTPACPPVLRIVAGLFFLIAAPVMLLMAKINWPESIKVHESFLYSLGLTILGLMVGGLVINQLLPFFGVPRPLDRVPIVVTQLLVLTALAAWRRDRWRLIDGLSEANRGRGVPVIGRGDQAVLVAGAMTVIGSIGGAIRLNNEANSAVTIAMLILAAAVIVAVFAWRKRLQESTISVTIYLLSLALLLMTSLRGWFTTGHDIQHESFMFKLTSDYSLWDIGYYREVYNACLSITILPTIIQRATEIPDAYIFKTVFQVLYAVCPVIIYLIARRFASRAIAILASVYFIAFPTFFTDMPFLNRQEMAFFFLGIALFAITDQHLPVRTRQIALLVFGVGIILSHYSTTYVLLAGLILCWLFTRIHAIGARVIDKRLERLLAPRHRRISPRVLARYRRIGSRTHLVANFAVILLLGGLTYLWVHQITDTANLPERTIKETVNSATGEEAGERSADASYSIVGGEKPTAQSRLDDYTKEAIEARGRTKLGAHYPMEEVGKYATRVVLMDVMPVTSLGTIVEETGIKASTINRVVRGGATMMLQLFTVFGFLLVLLGRARGFMPSREFTYGAAGFMAILTFHVILPHVSSSYGILRGFSQGMFWFAPFLAAGSIQAFAWLGRSTSLRVALCCSVIFFLSLTGVIPQLLGGYPPQLHLNNSGRYYDIHYLHPEEISAIHYVEYVIGSDTEVETIVSMDEHLLRRMQSYNEITTHDHDILPVLVRQDAFVFLGYTTVHKNKVSFELAGDLGEYEYPIEFLDKNKSLIYSNSGARIYR